MADESKNEETVEETPVEETPAAEETPVVEEATPEAPAAEAETAAAADPVAEEAAAPEAAAVEEPAVPEAPETAAGDAPAALATAEEPVEEPVPAAEATQAAEAAEEPAAEAEEPAEEPAAEQAPAAPVQQSGPKPKRKRLPRSLRRTRTKAPRNPSGERKPIVRLEKPEHERGRRQERQGTVVSAVQDKTIVVQVATIKAHPRYKKVVRRSQRFHAHDEANVAKVGDVVRIVETRPLSKLKHWRLTEVVEEAK
jgi:small subunit ribosomal protein S17